MTTRREIAVETDTKLAAKYDEMAKARRELGWAGDKVHRAAGDRRAWDGRRSSWTMAFSHALATCTDGQAVKAYQDAVAKIERLRSDIGELDAIYRADPWNRYFLVTNANGHVHRGMNCKTCFATTEYAWLVELADCDEDAMITEFGEKACTVCFPDAPANPKFHGHGRRDREALAAKAAEKDARQAAKDAKRLAADEVFRVGRGQFSDRIETVAACKEVLRYEVELRDHYGTGEHPWHQAYVQGAEDAKRVLLAREARNEGWGATQEQIDKIIASAVKKNRADGARI